ncbi:di-trans,poly-cis-decaprenylcistransferase, partial [candidate division WWE3 bacterium]|nr:di-trans,poly-cis-decaprenylcistransferase [candidate division WWE3 bacterium]
ENWKRSKQEVDGLWSLVKDYANYYRKLCLDNEIRLIHIGRKDRLPSFILKLISEVEEETKHFTRIFAPAFDYGGHDEIVRAINRVQEKGLEVSEKTIEANLDTATLPPVDLIIRTGDVVRLSGFLSWQSEYAEYYFSQKMFPDFGTEDLEDAVMQFCKVERRFGGDGALALAKK